MAANVQISTGLRNRLLGNESLRDIFRGGKIQQRTGAPALPDAAFGGSLLTTITRLSLTSKVAQVMRITPTAGTANAAEWRVTVNGDTVVFVDDGTPSAAEICTGLTALLNALAGGTMTTPAGQIETAKCNGKFTVTNNGSTVDITSAAAGTPIDVTSTVAAGGGSVGTGTLVTTTQTEDAYGISLEAYADISAGIIEKTSAETWSGVAGADGTAGHCVLMTDADDGSASSTLPRLVGICNTSNAPFIVRSTNVYSGATQTIDTFKITLPAS